jgi:hypothetical protein
MAKFQHTNRSKYKHCCYGLLEDRNCRFRVTCYPHVQSRMFCRRKQDPLKRRSAKLHGVLSQKAAGSGNRFLWTDKGEVCEGLSRLSICTQSWVHTLRRNSSGFTLVQQHNEPMISSDMFRVWFRLPWERSVHETPSARRCSCWRMCPRHCCLYVYRLHDSLPVACGASCRRLWSSDKLLVVVPLVLSAPAACNSGSRSTVMGNRLVEWHRLSARAVRGLQFKAFDISEWLRWFLVVHSRFLFFISLRL